MRYWQNAIGFQFPLIGKYREVETRSAHVRCTLMNQSVPDETASVENYNLKNSDNSFRVLLKRKKELLLVKSYYARIYLCDTLAPSYAHGSLQFLIKDVQNVCYSIPPVCSKG